MKLKLTTIALVTAILSATPAHAETTTVTTPPATTPQATSTPATGTTATPPAVSTAAVRVIAALGSLPAKTTHTKRYLAAVAAAKKAKGTVTTFNSSGKFVGFDVKANKATSCVFTDATSGRWVSAPTSCKQYFLAVRTPDEQAKAKELGKLGLTVMMKALSLASQGQTTVEAVLAEAIAASNLPADVSCELVNDTLTLRSSLFPNVRSNFTLKG